MRRWGEMVVLRGWLFFFTGDEEDVGGWRGGGDGEMGKGVGKGMDGLCESASASASRCWLRLLMTMGERWKGGGWLWSS